MNVSTVLAEIDEEISRLKQARALLTDEPVKKAVGRPKKDVVAILAKPKKRKLSAAGKAKIAAAQKARWAELRKTAGKKATPAKKTLRTVKAPKKPVASVAAAPTK
jgi:hypothetical protein